VFLLATIYLVWRIVNSRFGLVIQGARSNERRMRAIGFPTYRYKLTCFVIAGMVCGFAGVLLANSTDFISPAIMQWTRSGDLIVMVVLGGMGSVIGPVIGAVTLLVLEELLPYLMRAMVAVVLFVIAPIVKPSTYAAVSAALANAADYWQIILGPLLLLVVLFARGGIDGLLMNWRDVVAGVRGGIGRLVLAARGGINGLFASLRRG
jgi:branched-chain amino acid transport system permease protein